jgi:N-acetyl-gamma-glutamyl-phosphate reductase
MAEHRPSSATDRRLPVAVVGASGYTGAELMRILLDHPHARVAALYAQRAAGSRLDEVYPQFAGRLDLPIDAFDADEIAARVEVAFTALPHGASADAIRALRERGVAVIDLSADFRLRDAAVYASWYAAPGGEHPAPALLAEAVYGLPERYREQLRSAELIACPGCYPTGAVLAIAPLIAAGLVDVEGLVIDSKSGASGAGRTPGLATHLPEAAEGIRAYKVAGGHRHTPEIEQELGAVAGRAVTLLFTPHLVPMSRGIFSCVYATAARGARARAAYREALVAAYAGEPFVTVLAEGRVPDTAHVRGSNRVHVAVAACERTGRVLAMSAIDNLVKGAAGQAVQCLNLMRGWDETAGLGAVGLFP